LCDVNVPWLQEVGHMGVACAGSFVESGHVDVRLNNCRRSVEGSCMECTSRRIRISGGFQVVRLETNTIVMSSLETRFATMLTLVDRYPLWRARSV